MEIGNIYCIYRNIFNNIIIIIVFHAVTMYRACVGGMDRYVNGHPYKTQDPKTVLVRDFPLIYLVLEISKVFQ